jgi:FtsH-binding integral membrane protein
MSETNSYWTTLIAKIIGIAVIIIGGLMLYYTATTKDLGSYNIIFICLGAAVVIAGVLLLVVKLQE